MQLGSLRSRERRSPAFYALKTLAASVLWSACAWDRQLRHLRRLGLSSARGFRGAAVFYQLAVRGLKTKGAGGGLMEGEAGRPKHPHPEGQKKEDTDAALVVQLQVQLADALAEIENIKAIATVCESTKQEAIDDVRRKCQEEVASLQTIMKESISNYESRLSNIEKERAEWQQYREQKEVEVLQLRKRGSATHLLDGPGNNMRKAHEDSEKLQSIVMPMEWEITALKRKLARAESLISQYQAGRDSPDVEFLESDPSISDPASKQFNDLLRTNATEAGETSDSAEDSLRSEPSDSSAADSGSCADEADLPLCFGADTFARNCDTASIASFSMANSSLVKRLTPDQEETASLISTGTLVPECIYIPPPGHLIVPDHEWNQLQQEVKQQQVSLHQTKERLERVNREKEELQEVLRSSTDACAKQVSLLLDQTYKSEQLLLNLQSTFCQSQYRAQEQLADLAASHKKLCSELGRLKEENEGLKGKYSLHVSLQQAEDFTLPNSIQELQNLVQQYRKDLVSMRTTSEHQEERLRIEIVTLQDQLQSEQCAKQNLQEMLQSQLDTHREEIEILDARLSTLRTEADRIHGVKSELEEELTEKVRELAALQAAHPEQQRRLQEEQEEKNHLQSLLREERSKGQRLQGELQTSEEVRHNFVRLSQTLQVRLELIRQADSLEQVREILNGTRLTDLKDLKDA
nr:PREDICTED: rab GTPase-binding effector protein 2 isoform X1 [Latimeria chalumnae]|eukprot:XP_006005930.2 PREDICTED: rab GTPase-binding effector protein 2 isoform X1 [Latimeria chalumnae]